MKRLRLRLTSQLYFLCLYKAMFTLFLDMTTQPVRLQMKHWNDLYLQIPRTIKPYKFHSVEQHNWMFPEQLSGGS